MKKLRVEKGEDQGRGRGLKHSFCPVALFQGSTLRSLPDSILELGLSSDSEQCFSEFDVLTRYLGGLVQCRFGFSKTEVQSASLRF